ncbi:hypothetical protein [Micromonospora sp. U21]|uniref:hypothetical protein n=1 Tax=Micromonospora sp. U21 TaxID=2824899 RepID=UPI001B37FB56|nr:hypothetical protein [Micromonospora sp. U21]MBQ0903756.1 hypothetical protein [Micromonospora sp. U21]
MERRDDRPRAARLVPPHPLRDARTVDGSWWRDYRLNAWDADEAGGAEELTRGAYLLTEARLLWHMPTETLAEVQQTPISEADRFDQAVKCLEALVWALNREVTPMIAQLQRA